MALSAYRQVLRSIRLAFQGDQRILVAARSEARTQFDRSSKISVGSEEAVTQIEHAKSVAQILRQNVVQGQQEGENRYKLRIHEDTEKGDNETITRAPKGKIDRSAKCQ